MVATPNIRSPLANKVILVIGESGSWGQTFTKAALSHNPKAIRIFSRGELLHIPASTGLL